LFQIVVVVVEFWLRPKRVRFRLFTVIDIHISQGSVVTHLRCGGIFNDFFIASFLLSLMRDERILKIVQYLENLSPVDKSIVSRFLTHDVE